MLLTEDKDFGQLVYADARDSNGVILLRFPPSAREALASLVQETIQRLGDRLTDSFVVLEPNRVRIGRSPGR